jgi:hypothetical protein
MKEPEKLSGAMRRALKGLNLDQRMKEARAMALWPDVVGEMLAARTRPLHVNRGTLVVAVASSAWAQQLSLLKPQLIAKLAERVGPNVIRDLRWRTGPQESLPGPEELASEAGAGGRALPPAPPLPASEAQAIARLTGGIPDAKLAERIARTLEAQARRRLRQRESGWAPCRRCGVLYDPADRPVARQPAPADGGGGEVDVVIRPAGPGEDPLALARLCPVCRLEVQAVLE